MLLPPTGPRKRMPDEPQSDYMDDALMVGTMDLGQDIIYSAEIMQLYADARKMRELEDLNPGAADRGGLHHYQIESVKWMVWQ